VARPFVLTERDLNILYSLAQVRYLTVQHVQWLHWHSLWRAAERAAREAGVVNRRPKKTYERLAVMAERGLLRSIQRTVDRAATLYHRLPNCLSLTQAGAELLAAHRDLPREGLWYDERATRSVQTLEHSLGIGAFYAALRAELEYRGRRLDAWAADHVLCTDYDSVPSPALVTRSRSSPTAPLCSTAPAFSSRSTAAPAAASSGARKRWPTTCTGATPD